GRVVAAVGDEAVEAPQGLVVELVGAAELGDLLVALAHEGDGRRDAVELEEAVALGAAAVVVVRVLAPRQREVGLAVGVLDGLLAGRAALAEDEGYPVVP